MELLDYLPDGKRIVKTLLFHQQEFSTVFYRRKRADRCKGRVRKSSVAQDQLSGYVWERVTGNVRDYCHSWQVVQCPTRALVSLPHRMPIWKDDPTDGHFSAINFKRIGKDERYLQAPIGMVSGLLGERCDVKVRKNDKPVWGIVNGFMFVTDRRYSLGLIEARTATRKNGLKFKDVLEFSASEMRELGLSNAAVSSVVKLQTHKANSVTV